MIGFGFSVTDKQTGKYPDTEQIVLTEEWAKGLIYCDISGFVVGEDGNLYLMDDCGNIVCCPPDRFDVKLIIDDCKWLGFDAAIERAIGKETIECKEVKKE